MTQKEIVKSLESVHAKYRNRFLGGEELVSIGNLCHEAADLIESLTAENKRLKEERRWIPLTERIPTEQDAEHNKTVGGQNKWKLTT